MSERGDLTAEFKREMQGEGRFAMTGVEYKRRMQALDRQIEEYNRDPLGTLGLCPGAVNLMPAPQPQPQGHVHPRYAELHAKMRAICEAKNSDYADDQADPLRNFRECERIGISAFDGTLTRMSDKWQRICNLRRKEREDRTAAVKDESITDTLLDLANYALIAIVLHEEMRG